MLRSVPARVITLAAAASIALSTQFEGLKYRAYRDPVGIPTICHGHTAGVLMGQVATPAECAAMLDSDTREAMTAVLTYSEVDLNENELGAFTDFTLNVGANKFKQSTILRMLNAGDKSGACKQLLRWVYAGGQRYQGLVNRRAKEYALCIKPSGIQ